MEQFNNVCIIKKANTYFEGKVTSRVVLFEDGTKKTLGIMLPGEYEFGTDLKEEMEIIDGHLEYKLQGEENWNVINGAGVFYVPANSKFQLKIHSVVDYCCSYIKED
ncbi:pyrimidine/purine nucleoside phosphorylase [Bacillus sp. Marseille-P3661]|uniref:pyrimidine/purine nucleoside phosphorylase n=1 Tax=Bacillus sp. Marseille-P3661 TaxID=1936234 RepID=UPI000C81EE2B|nr:pyrimidine/purine nucleoside phosphorylase [Bacillus sp. Marseille-P3661]